jgi:hypothetical protein
MRLIIVIIEILKRGEFMKQTCVGWRRGSRLNDEENEKNLIKNSKHLKSLAKCEQHKADNVNQTQSIFHNDVLICDKLCLSLNKQALHSFLNFLKLSSKLPENEKFLNANKKKFLFCLFLNNLLNRVDLFIFNSMISVFFSIVIKV